MYGCNGVQFAPAENYLFINQLHGGSCIMDTTLKQRILGIIVLVALLGLCLNVLLHHSKNQQRLKAETIAKTPPAIVNTTSSLLNSTHSANMTPANTNVFSNDDPMPSTSPSSPMPIANPEPNPTNANPNNVTAAAPESNNALNTNPTVTTQAVAIPPASTQQSKATVVNANNNPETAATSSQPSGVMPISPATTASIQMLQNQMATTSAALSKIKSINSAQPTNAVTPTAVNSAKSSNVSSLPSDDNAVALPTPVTKTTATVNKTHAHKSVTPITHAKTAPKPHAAVTTTKTTTIGSNNLQANNLVVQVGSFTLNANAETLADKLHAKGFTATTQKVHTAQGDMTRVIVGKNGLNHTQIETLRTQLQTEMQLSGFIVPADPESTVKKEAPSIKTSHHVTPAKSNTVTNANNDI
jgi:cell division septation protein DedD